MSEIRLHNVTKRFGDIVAVDDVSIDVNEGEFVVLLGPSGAGKTTTLRLIAGLERPEEGKKFNPHELSKALSAAGMNNRAILEAKSALAHAGLID